MVEEDDNKENKVMVDLESTEEWLAYANDLVPMALEKARGVKGFQGRWKTIISKLEQIPTRLSDLSSHPCFTKNALCKEQLQAISKTLNESLEMAEKCCKDKQEGKLQMQSDLDALSGKIDLNLRDCGLLIKTGILGEVALSGVESVSQGSSNITELLARLQIGHLEARHKSLDNLVELMREDEKTVLPFLGRSSLSALVQLLTAATSPIIREKAVTLICTLAEAGTCNSLLVSEGVLPPLIRLLESGSSVGREKSSIALQRLSMSGEIARSIVGHGGVQPLIEVCCGCTGDSVSQASATCALKNLSMIPELHQNLAEEGVVRIMVSLLDDSELLLVSKEYAAECLQNLTLSNDDIKQSVISEGGLRSLLAYLDISLPQEPAIRTIRNLVGSVSAETLISLGLLPRLANVLKTGSTGAQTAAIGTICRICESLEVKKVVGESGCIPLLVKLLEVKANEVREVAAQALASLMTLGCNVREVKRDARSVPSLVQLLDPSAQNTAKKYAVCCLGVLSRSNKCRKVMISYGAIGYLKKLTEMDITGSKKLLERLQRGKFRSFLG